MKWLLLGGDHRSASLARLAAEAGHTVQAVGLGPCPIGVHPKTARDAAPADITVLPFPISEQEGCLPAPLSSAPIPLNEVSHLIQGSLWGGRAGEALQALLASKEMILHDPNDREPFCIANALPSAEGAIVSAFARSTACVCQSHVLIVGYGRIGRILARLLLAWNAKVCVAARRADARAWAQAEGCQAVSLEALRERAPWADVIFQTAPAPLVDEALLQYIRKDTLVSDLTRCGVDLQAAERMGIAAWRDSGIPGRYAPETAARILFDTIVRGEDHEP